MTLSLNIQEVPSSGLDRWLPLEKPESGGSSGVALPGLGRRGGGGRGARGEVHINLLLSTEKDQSLTSQEHKHLLKILFAFELPLDSPI